MNRIALLVLVLGVCACPGCLDTAVPADGSNATPSSPECLRTPLFFTSLHGMQRVLDPEITLALPHQLPDGYLFSTGTWLPGSDDAWRSVAYLRGEDRIMLYQRPADRGGLNRAPNTTVDGAPAQFVPGDLNQLSWSRHNLTFRLTASLPEEELVAIAKSVRPTPYDPDTPPPYGYVPPADPLVGACGIHRTVCDHSLAVTLRTLECHGDGCELVFFVNISSPPGPAASPGPTLPPRSPDPHGEFRVDNGTPLRVMQSVSYRPVDDGTVITWRLDPLPSDAGVLHARITRFGEHEGPWVFTISLQRIYPETTGPPFFYDRELTVNTAAFIIRTDCPLSGEQIQTLQETGVRRLAPSEYDTVYHSLVEEDRVGDVGALGFVEDLYPHKIKEGDDEMADLSGQTGMEGARTR